MASPGKYYRKGLSLMRLADMFPSDVAGLAMRADRAFGPVLLRDPSLCGVSCLKHGGPAGFFRSPAREAPHDPQAGFDPCRLRRCVDSSPPVEAERLARDRNCYRSPNRSGRTRS